METIKCKVCGGNLRISDSNDLGTCEYCGTTQTITKDSSDENKIRLFNMGNRYRTAGEFDRAISLYEKATEMDDTDPEAHWCLALSRNGIEYVNSSGRYIPTCHRVGVQTILQDLDYQAALEHANSSVRLHYEDAAKEIAEVQKRILTVSQQEDPFDVFICYKESDENGKRTRDSQIAQEFYYNLTEKGYRVFYSRITLENILGHEYEPYIYAALHSAKVMLVIGTKKEYMEAPWVKNEWSRFLKIMSSEKGRLLIPCYRYMDPYDIPDELNVLQCQNLEKIGALEDIVRGIEKVLYSKKTDSTETKGSDPANPSTGSLLERAQIFLDNGVYEKAIEYSERVLDLEPKNGNAYMIRLLADYKKNKTSDLRKIGKSIQSNVYFISALQYGDDGQKNTLNKCLEDIAFDEKVNEYNLSVSEMDSAFSKRDIDQMQEARIRFKSLGDFKDSSQLAQKCEETISMWEKENQYSTAMRDYDTAKIQQSLELYRKVIQELECLCDYKDSKSKKTVAEIEADALEKKENLYIKVVHMQDELPKKSPSDKTTKEYFELYDNFLNLGHYKDCSSRVERLESVLAKYFVDRKSTLANNYAALASQKKSNPNTKAQLKKEIDDITNFCMSHNRLELVCGKYRHSISKEIANNTRNKSINPAFEDLLPKTLLGIGVIILAVIFFAAF